MTVALDEGVGLSGQDAGQMFHLKVLGQAQDELHHQQHILATVEGGTRVQAIVA